MPRPNSIALKSAPVVTAPKGKAEAFILEYGEEKTEKRLWTFFYNPQSLRYSRAAKYSSTETFAARVQDQQYGYTEGKTLEISDIILDSYCMGRTVRPLIEGINKLLEARLERGEFAPPVLSFIFGTQRFAPCALTKVSWDETAWIGGDPARVKMSLSFIEMPIPESRGKKSKDLQLKDDADNKAGTGKPSKPLTDRQQVEAKQKAREWLNKNQSKLDPQTQKAIRSNQYDVTADPKTGDVKLLSSKKQAIGTVGRWDGKIFKTENVGTLIKKK